MDDDEASKLAKALSHPLRIEYLRALKTRRQLSPSDFAREFGAPLGNVSYHVKALYEANVLEVAGTFPRRGALEHRYSFSGRHAATVLAVMNLLAAR